MKDNQFLRFAIMFSNGQAHTFNRNLSKLIKLVLFDENKSMTIAEIMQAISNSYSLNFSDKEIEAVINNFQKESFEIEKDNRDRSKDKIRLSIEEIDKVKKYFENDKLEETVNRFITTRENIETNSKEKVLDLLQRYIYFVFNKDVKTLSALLKTETKDFLTEDNVEFSKDERMIINEFLSWNDPVKNTVIYEIVSSGFEYCMLTIKKDNASYKDVFNGKIFYLDANIIFRLAGINNTYRKEIIEAFVKKCRESNIVLKYTNFTQNEIDKTIEYQVQNIKNLMKGQAPLKSEVFAMLSNPSDNMDFYELYYEWSKKSGTNFKDYSAFEKYLKQKISAVLNNIEFEVHEKFSVKNPSKNSLFINTVRELTQYKKEKKFIRPKEDSVKVDVENYLIVEGKNSLTKSTHNSFTDKKYYLITADHYLIDWAESRIPGAVPTVVLPSVWYSLMLKYSGRTEDDYKAFTQFLKLPISEDNGNLDIKRKLLACVLALDETPSIKEEIIFNINEDLKNQIEILNVKEYVEKEHVNVTEQKVAEAVKKERKAAKEISELTKTVEKTISFDEGKIAGIKEGEENVYKRMAQKRVKINKIIRCIGKVIFAGCLIILAIIVGVYILGCFSNKITEAMIEKIELRFDKGAYLITLLISGVLALYRNSNFLSVNEEYLTEKFRKKHSK